jgi:hypothetical protein
MKRPRGVTLLGVLFLLVGVLLTGGSALTLVLRTVTSAHIAVTLPASWEVVVGLGQAHDLLLLAAQLALGVAALVSGIALLQMHPWAWLMALDLLGCELAILLGYYLRGQPAYWAMLVSALLVLYLNQRPIREAFTGETQRSMFDESAQTVQSEAGGSRASSARGAETRMPADADAPQH